MNNEQLAKAIVKAIGYTENGGKPDPTKTRAGKTGEMKSVFQFTPDTWKNYSKQVFGKETPLTPDAETYVVHQKVTKWLEQGYTPKQIASIWNAGPGEPNAYTGKFSDGSPSRGVNKKYGVKFDVPSYADKVDKYVSEFTRPTPLGETAGSTPATVDKDPIDTIVALMKKGSSVKPETAQAPKQGLIQQSLSQAQPNAPLV